jgi:hypothetical protein
MELPLGFVLYKYILKEVGNLIIDRVKKLRQERKCLYLINSVGVAKSYLSSLENLQQIHLYNF